MTHDLEMFEHFSKIFDDIEEKRKLLEKKHKTKIKKIAYDNLQLENGRLSLLPTKSYNDYAAQLRSVYQFATNHQNEKGTSSNTQSDLYIGNVMRRVIESFATFCYQMGTSSIFNDSDILEQLPTSHQKLFGSFMYRLVFNSESHGEESVKSRGDSYYIELISHPELQKTAQMLIIFMNDLNSLHLQKNIPDFSLETVHTWEDLII